MPAISTMSRLGGKYHARVKSRWMVLTQEPVAGYYLLIYLDGISGETLSNRADVPTHPIDQSSSVSDHAVKGAKAYNVQGFLGTPLVGDNVAPRKNGQEFVSSYGDVPVLISPPTSVTRGIANTTIFNDRGASLIFTLEKLLGVPVDLFSPRYGKMQSFVLTSYNDQRNGSTLISVDLSFQELRRATVDRVVIPKIPRARNQEPVAKKGDTLVDPVTGKPLDDKSAIADFLDYYYGGSTSANPSGGGPSGQLGQIAQDLPPALSSGFFEGATGVKI